MGTDGQTAGGSQGVSQHAQSCTGSTTVMVTRYTFHTHFMVVSSIIKYFGFSRGVSGGGPIESHCGAVNVQEAPVLFASYL